MIKTRSSLLVQKQIPLMETIIKINPSYEKGALIQPLPIIFLLVGIGKQIDA